VTRFVVDCDVVLRLASEETEVAPEHELLAPTLLRSQTLSALHEAVHRGELAPAYDAEYVALTQLQADAFVTLNAELARSVEGIVETATIDALPRALSVERCVRASEWLPLAVRGG